MSSPFRKRARLEIKRAVSTFHVICLVCISIMLSGCAKTAQTAVTNEPPRAEWTTPQQLTPTAPPSTSWHEQHVLKVCADPNNLPFSNKRGEGFENKIAELVAKDSGPPPEIK